MQRNEKLTVTNTCENNKAVQSTIPISEINEGVDRPDILRGTTFKIKAPESDHAVYVTINHYVLNEGQDNESRHPFELFINTKNMESFQWIAVFTRSISAVFRKGGEYRFLLDEMKQIKDPKGSYVVPGKGFVDSTVAHIGEIVEQHLIDIGALPKEGGRQENENS